MIKIWKEKSLRLLALILAGAIWAACPSGCASAASQPGQNSSSVNSSVRERIRRLRESNKAKEKEEEKETEQQSSAASQPSQSSGYTSVQERMRRLREKEQQQQSSAASQSTGKSSQPAEKSSEPAEQLKAGPSTAEISRLARLQADVETRIDVCYVDVDDGENPYDVTWDYGPLYNTYVDSIDWGLLFDTDYYIETFPALAMLYHQDQELLLKHFQTVGIHEGRQGNDAFNVAAYMENCDSKVKKAFGDSYECYYFYYAMNYKTEKAVATAGENQKKQLTVKLTTLQQNELDNINKYRDEVGAAPVTYDPELSALACYRAYIDALEDWDAHDWLETHDEEVYGMMDLIVTNRLGENTVHTYRKYNPIDNMHWYSAYYINYRYSQDHYEAMINEEYHYLGSSNAYISAYEKENPEHPDAEWVSIQYDVFTDTLTTPLHN